MERIVEFAGTNGLLVAFVFVGAIMVVAYWLSHHVARGKVHGSAIAIALGLLLAFWAGADTGGKADPPGDEEEAA